MTRSERARITRRGFLAGSAAGAAACLWPRAWQVAGTGGDDRVLVMLQQSGGNDVLSTLVPYADDAYGRARQATRIPAGNVRKLNDRLGLHPNLAGLQALYDRGQLAAVLNVGYPRPNYSHFTSLDIWHTADLEPKQARTGWLGRWCDAGLPADPPAESAVAIGGDASPLALLGDRCRGISIGRPETFRFQGDARLVEAYRALQRERAGADDPQLVHAARTSALANACSDRIRAAVAAHRPAAEYPGSALGRSLATVAAVIAAGLGTRVCWVFHGGYDTHAGQKPRHDALMAELDGAITAFQRDLEQHRLAGRVLTVAFSEFGRRVTENGSGGTDHGAAGAMLLFGPNVRPGLHGEPPDLTDLQGGGGGSLKHRIDFRQVYAAILERWLRTPSQPILGRFTPVDCVAV